ncbi:MAG: DUF2723 domain-containing protein [Bacteroidota bacterium]
MIKAETMNFKKLNITLGWVVFAIASITYLMTIEPTASFWDCGEFIATAYKLEVGHPPGAPFFMILARFFMIFSPGTEAALMTNVLSAFCSSFTILFLFWTITAFAKKMAFSSILNKDNIALALKDRKLIGDYKASEHLSAGAMIAILGSGLVGALAYTFSDSFWFSAVEGEVYAMSSLFTAVVFWAIMKYDAEPKHASYSHRWIILIAYLMGLSIGVHLLNLLAIPAIGLVYYLRNHQFNLKGLILTGLVSGVVLLFIQSGIIPGLVSMACGYEVYFTNALQLPFNVGTICSMLFGTGLIIGLIMHSHNPNQKSKITIISSAILLLMPVLLNDYHTGTGKTWMTLIIFALIAIPFLIKKQNINLNTAVLSFVMILLGYSTFALVVIRSSANPPMDENNPENQFTLLSYLNREQYGDRPLLSGQYFNAKEKLKGGSPDRGDGDPVFFKSYSVYNANKADRRKEDDRLHSFNNLYEAKRFIDESEGNNIVVEEYIISDDKKDTEIVYDQRFTTVFPRMYSAQSNHIPQYIKWSGAQEKDLYSTQKDRNGRTVRDQNGNVRYDRSRPKKAPSFGENWTFFLEYQANWMYWRYFMWNFAGRQNDIQGHGGLLEGNWLSGVDFIDERRIGSQNDLPSSMTRNKGYNRFFFIPLILGIIGLFYQLYRDHKNWLVVFLLFILTGLAIVIYLNQYPMQPRERDYAFVGSFYAFAIWIGLGVFALYDAAKNLSMKKLTVGAGIALGFVAIAAFRDLVIGNNMFLSAALLFLFGTAFIVMNLMVFLGQKVENNTFIAYLVTFLGLLAPAIMLAEGWDDHNRSKRKTAVDFASNYLETCEPNAILFTNGDNDTFPLWYAQEVEGVRTDVRVMNLSLSNTDWYIDQMKRKAYDSDPVPFSMAEEKYRQGTRDVCLVEEHGTFVFNQQNYPNQFSMTFPEGHDQDILDKAASQKWLYLNEAIDFLSRDENIISINGNNYHYLPTRTLRLPLDKASLMAKGLMTEADSSLVADYMEWKIPGSNLMKNNMMMLDMLASFNWDRPVYYAVTTGPDAYINLDPYFELEGLAYRLTPKKHAKSPNPNMLGGVNTDRMYQTVTEKFRWGNMDSENIYMDENNLRMTTNIRLHMANLAEKLIEEDKTDKAKAILDLAFEKMPEATVPFNQVVVPLADGYYALGEDDLANEIMFTYAEQCIEELEYYTSLDPEFMVALGSDIRQLFEMRDFNGQKIPAGILPSMERMVTLMYPQDDEILDKMDDLIQRAAMGFADYEDARNGMRKTKRKSKVKI